MLLTLIAFIIILSLLVFVHEFGHFLTAIKFGVKAEEFGFGLPPRAIGLQILKDQGKKKINWIWGDKKLAEAAPIVYSLNWLPIGGFVKIKGENGELAEAADSFGHQSIGRRIVILAAGVTMNILLAAILLSFGYGLGLPGAVDTHDNRAIIRDQQVQILEVLPGLPAAAADFRPGDVIMAVDQTTIFKAMDIRTYLADKFGQTVKIKIRRGQQELVKAVVVGKYQNINSIGVALTDTGIVSYPWYWAVYEGFKMTFLWLIMIIVAFAIIIKNLFSGLPAGIEVAGPVGIAVLTSQATKLGFAYILQFAALLSINLAIINILPFPALDGGRIMFLVIEKIRGRAIKQKWENLAHNVGFILLLCLVALVTYKDIIRYGGKIAGAFRRMIGL